MNRRRACFAMGMAIALGAWGGAASAAVVYVNKTAPGPTFDGQSWVTAFTTVQAGLNAAVAGDEVWVAAGTYVERITLKAGVALYGGFAGTETLLSQRNWAVNVALLDGGRSGSVVTAPAAATNATRIDGFTITRSGGNPGESGVSCVSASATVTNNIISDNGWGVYCSSSSAMIVGNRILRNSAGVQCGGGSPTVANNVITDNTNSGVSCVSSTTASVMNNRIAGNSTSTGGGGVYCHFSSPSVLNNTIVGNYAPNGGGVYCYYSSPVVANNVIAGNSALSSGGGAYCFRGSPVLTNNTIAGNSSPLGGGIDCVSLTTPSIVNTVVAFCSSGISQDASSTLTLRNNCVFGNTAYNYLGLADPTGSNANISADPLFAELSFGNLHIQPGSPCYDAGDATAVQGGWTDIDGQARTQGVGVDIGADESDGTSWFISPTVIRVSPTGNDGEDGSSWAKAKRTLQAGIDAASLAGGEVWVQGGTFVERVLIRPFVYLYGGFQGNEADRSQRDWNSNRAILDGNQAGSVVSVRAGYRLSTIDGLTIRNGKNSSGGGILCLASDLTITHNRLLDNVATGTFDTSYGGGIYSSACSPSILNNTFTGNQAIDGGGVFCNSSAVVANNVFTGNSASTNGGAIACLGLPSLLNNTLSGNAALNGGGIAIQYSTATNMPTIVNNIIAHGSSGLYLAAGASPVVRNNCVYGNKAYNYYAGMPDPTGTNGNISADPAFGSANLGDVHLQPASPCLNAGDNTVIQSGWTDLDNQPRIQSAQVDIGADESDGTTWTVTPLIVRVSPSGNDANDGSSWPLAKKTVQMGIESTATRGGEVWVQAGVFNERITVRAYVYVYGGFAGTETRRSERDFVSNISILDGGSGGSVVQVLAGYRVSAIDGFTIRNGSAPAFGGGIYCTGAPIIVNNQILSNTAGTSGGGICCLSVSPLILRNAIRGNSAQYGGGLYGYATSMRVSLNVIRGNNATYTGGGVACYQNASAILLNNDIASNTAGGRGGGVYCDSSSPFIYDNTIVGNTATYGGGISCFSVANPTVVNNIVAFDSSGIYKDTSAGTLTVRNNCVFGNTDYNYSGVTAGAGDVSADPQLVNRVGEDDHLMAGSPVVDTGDDSVVQPGDTDLDGRPRILGARVDMGAYEYTSDTTPPDTSITSGPAALTNATSATFSFTATEGGSTFQRSLDGAAYVTVASPESLTVLSDGAHTYQVRATDPSGNTDPTPASYAWTVDTSPPIAGTVNDGTGADIDAQGSATTISANWSGFSDPGSGIASYEWAIGTTPGGTDTQVFANVGTASGATRTGLSLTNGTTYYVTVRTTNGAGLTATTPSDGVLIDTSLVTQVSVPLAPGYNLIALPVTPQTSYTAEGLAQEVNAQGGTCTSVLKYENGAFTTHPVGTTVNNLAIGVGSGYFLRCTGASTWTVTGFAFNAASAPIALSPGYNLIGLPLDPLTAYTAERVGTEANGQGGSVTQVLKYENGAFVAHPVGTAINNFTLAIGRGYFVRCGAGSTWTLTR